MVTASVAYAADPEGAGIAYVRLGEGDRSSVLRIAFNVARRAALLGREVGYAALLAVAPALYERGIRRLRLCLEDEKLRRDLCEHAEVPGALTMAYVRLGCMLNRFDALEICGQSARTGLAERARFEAGMHAAA